MDPVATVANCTRTRRLWQPCAALRPYVLSFELRDDRLGEAGIFNPLPARTDCFLQFHFKQPYLVVSTATGEVHRAPTRVLVGPHAVRREDLIWTGDLRVFTIRFSAIGLRSIFGIPANTVRDIATSADMVMGSSVVALEARLGQAPDDLMPSIAEEFLLSHRARLRRPSGAAAVLRLTHAIQRQGTEARLQDIAADHSLSLRQVERLFQEFVGLSPKHFERLQRAKLALALRRSRSDWDWSFIAAASGYFDQAHLIREFRSLNGSTPEKFARTGLLAHEFRVRSSQAGSSVSPMSPLYNCSNHAAR